MSDRRNVVVNKPWGFEYLVYESSDVAVWLLFIGPGQQTSMHCHPKKTTGLVLLKGTAELNFLADSKFIVAPEKQMIRRGLFHATKAISPEGVFLFEVETPNDKEDLVRLTDTYGRVNDGYENSRYEIPKSDECLWIFEPELCEIVSHTIADLHFTVEATNNLDFLDRKSDHDIIMFLKGGIGKTIEGRRHLATIPGDVGRVEIIRKVAAEMEFVDDPTVILTISV